jgi:hypothetical protein
MTQRDRDRPVVQAAEELGITERQVRRLLARLPTKPPHAARDAERVPGTPPRQDAGKRNSATIPRCPGWHPSTIQHSTRSGRQVRWQQARVAFPVPSRTGDKVPVPLVLYWGLSRQRLMLSLNNLKRTDSASNELASLFAKR